MVGVLSRYRNMASVLLVAMAMAVVAASVSAVPARAEFSIYSCKSCSTENGPEVYVPEAMKSIGRVEGAKGVCSAVWENLGGGKWKEYLACTASESETSTATGFVGPFDGHGQVRRYYKEFLYNLWGEEQWV